jgi:U3 small nucleolar RNA-associated protein 11
MKELSARLTRDKMLRYAIRELEMQRLLMGKGSSTRIRGLEKVEGDEDNEEEEEEDAPKPKKMSKAEEKAYKPRVYKWKVERKR